MEHIVAVTHEFTRTGAPLYLLRTAVALSSQGVRFTVLGPVRGPLRDDFVAAGIECVGIPSIDRLYRGGRKRLGQVMYLPLRLVMNLMVAIELLVRFTSLRPDAIVLSSWSARFGAIPGRLMGLRVVWHIHEYLSDRGIVAGLERWWLTTFADDLIFNSEATRRWWIGERTDRSAWVLYDGVRIHEPVARESDRPIDVLFVGRVSREKGIECLLDACRALVMRGLECRLTLIGTRADDWSADEWNARTRSLSGHLTELGLVDDPRAWMRRAKILVLPSRREGFGRVLLEAMAEGCAVVASRVGGVPEIVKEGVDGLLVAPDDARGLSEALSRLLEDDAFRESMSRQARRSVESRFAISRTQNDMEQLYLNLLRGRST
jgi:glycosyltransferase involved in cell wall biosynthesis